MDCHWPHVPKSSGRGSSPEVLAAAEVVDWPLAGFPGPVSLPTVSVCILSGSTILQLPLQWVIARFPAASAAPDSEGCQHMLDWLPHLML